MRRLFSLALAAVLLLAGSALGEVVAPHDPGPWVQTGHLLLEGFPQLTPEGFLPEGQREFVQEDPVAGIWRYASQTLRIVINKEEIQLGRDKSRYLAAHIFLKEGEPGFRMLAHSPGNLLKGQERYKEQPWRIARNHRVVFSMDGDYFLYRILRQRSAGKGYSVGLVIRDGEILLDDPASPRRRAYPPLDMMALFDDGSMAVYEANEYTAQQLVDLGARDVLTFGPWLVRDGVINEGYINYGTTLQPRAGMGTFGRGHYLALIVEGRIRDSKGMTTRQFGDLFLQLGCPAAFNLDGGWTSAMIFMGTQLNQLDKNGVRNNARPQNEIMGIGYTQAYDQEEAP